MGSGGSSSDAQIFNRSVLRMKIEGGTLELLPVEPLEEGGPNMYYFLLGDAAFALIPWMVKPYSRRQLTIEERIGNYKISRGRRVENAFELLVSRFRVLLGTMEQRPEIGIAFICVLLHMVRTHQCGAGMATTQANDVVALRNAQVVYVPGDNHRNSLREANHQFDLLKHYFNNMGAGGQDLRGVNHMTEAGIYQSFSGLQNYSKNFYLSWCSSNFQIKSNPFSTSFKFQSPVEILRPKLCKNDPV